MQRIIWGNPLQVQENFEKLTKEGWTLIPGTTYVHNACSEGRPGHRCDKNGLEWEQQIFLFVEKKETT